MLKVCIVGASGRMGRNIAKCVYEGKDMEVSGAADRPDSPFIGVPVYEAAGCGKGGAIIVGSVAEALEDSDVVIDFTGAKATVSNIPFYEKAGIPLVIGSTGFSGGEKQSLESLGEKIPLLLAPNMSFGVNVVLKLIEMAAKTLPGYDVEISEIHHRMKKDAPSGTALAMAEAAAKGAGLDLEEKAVYCRHGMMGERKDGEIGIQSMRGGDVIGDHTVFFFGGGERIEITHRAHTRETFAAGAVKAAEWLVSCGKPGRIHDMDDVLGLK